MTRPIREGDLVDVFYADGQEWTNLKVLHVPVNTGDMWYFYDTRSGRTIAQNPNSSNLDSIITCEGKRLEMTSLPITDTALLKREENNNHG
jgi:hypothetical protein